MFRIDDRLVTKVGAYDSKNKKKAFNSEVQWATLYQNDATKMRAQEKKKLRKMEKKATGNGDEISDRLNAVNMSPSPVKVKLNKTHCDQIESTDLLTFSNGLFDIFS